MINKKVENRLTLLGVILFAFIITSVIIYINATHNILGHSYRDVYFYLIESLRFSGVDISGYAYVSYLPPFIPFLTSLLFRLGFVSETSIFITSGVFFFVGIVGMFHLLRLRFNNFYSFFGTFLYATLMINVKWVGNGTLDIAFVALMIWALYFFIQGMEKNQKYFYLAFPLLVLSFFTKYTGALMAGVMILYFMSRTNIARNIQKYFKNLVGGIIAGIITSVPFFAYYFIYDVPLGFINQAEEVSSTTSTTATHAGQLIGNDLFYYIRGIINDISANNYLIGLLIIVVMIIGIVVMIYLFQNTFRQSYSSIKDSTCRVYKWEIPSKIIYVLLLISIIMVLTSFFTASLFSFVYSEILLFMGMYLLAYTLTKILIRYENVDNVWLSTYPYLAMNIAMVGFFLAYLVFFSSHLTKADRYFTSMAPGFIFLVTLSVEILMDRIKGFDFKYIIPVLIMCLMLFSSFSYLANVSDDQLVLDEKSAASWISDKEGIVYSDRGPIYTWYLQKEVFYAKNYADEVMLNQELLDGDAEYYIAMNKVNLTSYSPVKEYEKVTIYQINY